MLIAGDMADLPGITAALVCLSADAYGQVLVEVAHDQTMPVLTAPPRVTVHRIDASPLGGGIAVGQAVAAWVGEWIPDEIDERRAVTMWVGERVEVACPEILGLVERI